jgi:restriction system protein
MARGVLSTINAMAREAERAARAQARARAQFLKDQERRQRLEEKLQKQSYLESRITEVDQANAGLAEQLDRLDDILAICLKRDPSVDFSKLLKYPQEADLDSDPALLLPEEPRRDAFMPTPPGFLARLVPGASRRYSAKVIEAERSYSEQMSHFNDVTRRRSSAMAALKTSADANNRSVQAFQQALENGEQEVVRTYCQIVLERSEYPDGFPQELRVAFEPQSKQVIIDYRLPKLDDVIPIVDKFKYVKSSDEVVENKKPERIRQSLYASVIAQTVLRSLHEVFVADKLRHVDGAVFSGYVDTTDPGTGHRIRPYIISVRATRDQFEGLDLSKVDPSSCLKRLGASVSRSPAELVPVKPIIDFNMVDPRFIQEQDVLGTLDSRANLMELSPGDFESLITNLFQKMGLDTKLTRPSRDGGVDCVAYDARPILGGKVIVQAKRYKNTVGVSAVRDLFGTMINEGASKGILVTTSGYGKAAYEFANGKPIELITGSNLLYLLKENANFDAKIEIPDDWVDPRQDISG